MDSTALKLNANNIGDKAVLEAYLTQLIKDLLERDVAVIPRKLRHEADQMLLLQNAANDLRLLDLFKACRGDVEILEWFMSCMESCEEDWYPSDTFCTILINELQQLGHKPVSAGYIKTIDNMGREDVPNFRSWVIDRLIHGLHIGGCILRSELENWIGIIAVISDRK